MASAKERAAAKSAASHARQQGKDVSNETAATLAEEKDSRDFDNAALQYKIEHPETKSFVLDLSAIGYGDREIIVKTAFSYADVNDLKIIADIESYASLFLFEVSRIGVGAGDPKWHQHVGLYLETVSRESIMREKANSILSKISEYAEPWSDGAPVIHHRVPTFNELIVGLDAETSTKVSSYLMGRAAQLKKEHADRKKARAVAVSG